MNNLISKFYTAFQKRDFLTMQSCYHAEATFTDPVFQNLNSTEVRAMWEMLLTSAKDLTIEFSGIHSSGENGRCHWEAWYTFTATGRKVHNIIDAEFVFRDGLIFRHTDRFDLWRWSRQALGLSGLLLGWSPVVSNKIRKTARGRLDKFIASKNEGSAN